MPFFDLLGLHIQRSGALLKLCRGTDIVPLEPFSRLFIPRRCNVVLDRVKALDLKGNLTCGCGDTADRMSAMPAYRPPAATTYAARKRTTHTEYVLYHVPEKPSKI